MIREHDTWHDVRHEVRLHNESMTVHVVDHVSISWIGIPDLPVGARTVTYLVSESII
jgi:hypothetical protein